MMDISAMGGTLHRPLYFEFDKDPKAFTSSHKLNFMMGSAIKVSVNSVSIGNNMTEFYFPQGTWCNLLKGNGSNTCLSAPEGGLAVNLSTKANESYAHLRIGHIVAMKDFTGVKVYQVMNTADANQYPVQLHINPICVNGTCHASGTFSYDDGTVFDNTNLTNKMSF